MLTTYTKYASNANDDEVTADIITSFMGSVSKQIEVNNEVANYWLEYFSYKLRNPGVKAIDVHILLNTVGTLTRYTCTELTNIWRADINMQLKKNWRNRNPK